MTTAVWGHRGASGYAPENTVAAFELAAAMGADGVELDVQLSADGQVVVIHDETLDRTTNAHGPVQDFTAAQLAATDTGRGAGVPLLDEVFALLKPTRLLINVELKNSVELYPGMEQLVVDLIDAYDMQERVVVLSFNHYSLATVRELAPLPLGVLSTDLMYEPWQYAKTVGAAALHPHWKLLRLSGYVEQAHAAGLRVHPWTVNEPDDIAWVVAQGVDALITNYPDRALAAARR
ncbi:MAG: glycerophosphodiester phosphodiesterase [Propionibacteriaceae bacterium]